MRIIYLGTPEFAVPTLEKLLSWPQAQVVGLVTQPDRPAGRGKNIFPPPTKLVAEAHNIPVFQPEKLSKAPEIVEAMKALKPDVLVMVAFGQILKKEVLNMAPLKVVNLHGSLLPAYRGAAPINWAIINGETVTGNTTMFSEAGVDTGPMLLKQEVPIGIDTTAEDLAHTMSVAGADLVIETLDQLAKGTLEAQVQDDSKATFAPRLSKDMGKIDWTKSAAEIHNLVRGLYPWPGTFTEFSGGILKVTRTKTVKATSEAAPGTIAEIGEAVVVNCGGNGDQALALIEVQPPNKARMSARDWANGARLTTGTILGAVAV